MAKQYPKNARAESATGYGPTPDADLYQGEKPGPEGFGARGRSQTMSNAQKRTMQALVNAGIDPDHAYLITIGEQSLTQAEHDQVANAGKNRRAPPKGSSPADLDPLEGAPAGDMPVDKRVDNKFNPQTGKPIKPRKAGLPPAPNEEETFEPTQDAYKGYEQFGARNWGSQDKRSSDERAEGRERVQRTQDHGAFNDEINSINHGGMTSEERRLNARVLSPKQQEEKRRAEQDDAAKLRHKQMKPKYDAQTGELLQDHRLERNGWRQTKGPDGRMRYTATDTFDDGSSNGVESQARIDARNGIVRDPDGNVLRSPGPGGGKPVFGPDRFRNNQQNVPPKPSGKPQGGGAMSIEPEDMADLNAVPPPPQAYGPQEDNRPPMRQKWSHQTGPAPSSQDFIESPPAWARPPVAGQPAAPPAGGGQMAIPPEEGDGYGPVTGGRQLGEGLDGGTDQQRELRIRRIAKTRGVPASVVRQEIEAAEAAGAASGEFGYNSARAWRDPLEKTRDARDEQANAAKARFKNQAMYGPAGRAMNLVNDTQFSNDPSPAGQWKNYMMAQALLNPDKGIVDPNAVTAANGERAFALASRLAGNSAFNGQQGTEADAMMKARSDKAHKEFYADTGYNVYRKNTDTPAERQSLVEDYVAQYGGAIPEATVRARLERVRGTTQDKPPGKPSVGSAPADPAAGGSFT